MSETDLPVPGPPRANGITPPPFALHYLEIPCKCGKMYYDEPCICKAHLLKFIGGTAIFQWWCPECYEEGIEKKRLHSLLEELQEMLSNGDM